MIGAHGATHPTTHTALRRLVASGQTVVVVVTGRPVASATRWARTLGAAYVVALGGAVVLSTDDGPLWTADGLAHADVEHLGRLAALHGVTASAHTAHTWHVTNETDRSIRNRTRLGLPAPLAWSAIAHPVLQVELTADRAQLDVIRHELDRAFGHLAFTQQSDHIASYLDVVPLGVDKGRLDVVLAHLGLTWDDVAAVGDGENDIPLLRLARTGVAVLRSHPDLVEIADLHLHLGPLDGAVGAVIDRFWDLPTEPAGRPMSATCQATTP